MLTTLLPWVFPLKCFPPLGLPLLVFFSLPLFFPFLPLFFLLHSPVFPLPFDPLFSAWLPSFYSQLIQWDFSFLPLGLHQLFLVCCGHPFKITHSPIGCPCYCSIQYMFAAPLIISQQNSFLFVPAVYLYLTTYLYGMHQMVPTIYYFFWVRYHPSKIYSPKEVTVGNQI